MQRRATNKLNLLALRRQYTHPHALYKALREQDGILFDETSQSWLITRHAVITTILDDPRFLSSPGSVAHSSSKEMSSIGRQMLFMEGEKHRRAQDVMLRSLAHTLKCMPTDIRKFVGDALAAVRASEEIEVVSEYASPISLLTIAHVLGIPTQDRQLLQQLEHWSDTFGDVTSGYFGGDMQNIRRLEDYFRELISERRRHPSTDLLSAFIESHEVFPEEDDLVANCMMVFAAGRITTKKLLGNGISLLLQQWMRYQREFNENPHVVKQLGEELLRMVTPTRYLMREASEDVDLSPNVPGKYVVHRGQRALLFLESADYDAEIFTRPEEFDPARRPNKHIAFGFGPHQCPGAALARVEIQIALEGILSLPDLRPKPGSCPIWNLNPNLGGYTKNPMVFDAAGVHFHS